MGVGRVIIVLIGRDNLMVSFSGLMARFSSAAIYGQRLNETSGVYGPVWIGVKLDQLLGPIKALFYYISKLCNKWFNSCS